MADLMQLYAGWRILKNLEDGGRALTAEQKQEMDDLAAQMKALGRDVVGPSKPPPVPTPVPTPAPAPTVAPTPLAPPPVASLPTPTPIKPSEMTGLEEEPEETAEQKAEADRRIRARIRKERADAGQVVSLGEADLEPRQPRGKPAPRPINPVAPARPKRLSSEDTDHVFGDVLRPTPEAFPPPPQPLPTSAPVRATPKVAVAANQRGEAPGQEPGPAMDTWKALNEQAEKLLDTWKQLNEQGEKQLGRQSGSPTGQPGGLVEQPRPTGTGHGGGGKGGFGAIATAIAPLFGLGEIVGDVVKLGSAIKGMSGGSAEGSPGATPDLAPDTAPKAIRPQQSALPQFGRPQKQTFSTPQGAGAPATAPGGGFAGGPRTAPTAAFSGGPGPATAPTLGGTPGAKPPIPATISAGPAPAAAAEGGAAGAGGAGAGMAGAAGVAGAAVVVAEKVLKVTGAVAAAPFNAIATGLGVVSGGLHDLQGPLGPIGAGLNLAGDAFKGLSSIIKDLPGLKAIGLVMGPVLDALGGIPGKIGELGTAMVSLASKTGSGAAAAQQMQLAIDDTSAVVGRTFVPIVELARDGIRLFGDALAGILPSSGEVRAALAPLGEAMEEIKPVVAEVVKALKGLTDYGMAAFTIAIKAVGEGVKTAVFALKSIGLISEPTGPQPTSVGASNRQAQIQGVSEYAKSNYIKAFSAGGETAPDHTKDISNKVGELYGVLGKISDFVQKIADVVAHPEKAAAEATVSVADRATGGRASAAVNAAGGALDTVTDSLRDARDTIRGWNPFR